MKKLLFLPKIFAIIVILAPNMLNLSLAQSCDGTPIPAITNQCEPTWLNWRYWRNCDTCCTGFTYDNFAWGNAKSCCKSENWNSLLMNIYNEKICCPANSTIYGPYWEDCCIWTPYGLEVNNQWWPYFALCCETPNIEYEWACVSCEDCRDLLDELLTVLAEAKWDMENQDNFPSDADIATFQIQIWALVTEYRETKNCDDVFNDDYSTCPATCDWTRYDNETKCCQKDKHVFYEIEDNKINGSCLNTNKYCNKLTDIKTQIPAWWSYNWYDKTTIETKMNVCDWDFDVTTTNYNMWIYCPPDKMALGQCKFDVYDVIGIRQSEGETSVGIFVQDIILSATMFIGTIITAAIIVSGLLFVFFRYQRYQDFGYILQIYL